MDELLLEILDSHSTGSLTINCSTYEERADALRFLRDHGCNINHGRNREGFITGADRDFHYQSPRFSRNGNVSCFSGTTYPDGISLEKLQEELLDIQGLRDTFAPPENIIW